MHSVSPRLPRQITVPRLCQRELGEYKIGINGPVCFLCILGITLSVAYPLKLRSLWRTNANNGGTLKCRGQYYSLPPVLKWLRFTGPVSTAVQRSEGQVQAKDWGTRKGKSARVLCPRTKGRKESSWTTVRALKLCESGGGRPGLTIPVSVVSLWT